LIVLFLSGIWFFSIGTEREPEINATEEQHPNNEEGHWLLLHINMSELHDQTQPFISANTKRGDNGTP
jgi:hypothetical protein